ncbi:glycogen debranching N-terminal domain-containing protein [Pseudactinotalea sp. HY158]|uniref:glycogen debranching N-terminal domain-containing protein n=1 Tax=Pseudactinotalea sp. HY158 TaxID=2654547 RepID=UPI00129D1886|nr:glycogen debranching N-terminal domain-containing protein [Pseudactinotalea sp. HY158]QGH69047.1 amylo-alpha-1,6-glucosidase [Pseudactinotalea sp. HY158]
MPLQPLLHDRLAVLEAPMQAWSGPDGQIGPGGHVDGVYCADTRVLNEARLEIGTDGVGAEPEHVFSAIEGADRARIVYVPRNIDGPGADPEVRCDRIRSVSRRTVEERIVLSSALPEDLEAVVTIHLATDLADMSLVKQGRGGPPVRPEPATDGEVAWRRDGLTVAVDCPGATLERSEVGAVATWRVRIPARGETGITWAVRADDARSVVTAPAWMPPLAATVEGPDHRLARLLSTSLEDLSGLVMSTRDAPNDVFVAAGAPWFFTLFGRDSLWTARMLLPLGTELAGGTLRTLARRQGTRDDPATAEQPGKIMHEIRAASQHLDTGAQLPSEYYGTIDATSLWINLLVDAWRWGMPSEEIEPLLGNLEAALAWQVDHGDADGDSFLEYFDESGTGLANQGWKDSADSVRFRDGTLADGAVALVEVQGYAYEAAVGGAQLLEAFGRDGTRWRTWAEGLRRRFNEQFWVDDTRGRYPAIALDGAKRPVDSLTSNIGHLIGTGILSPADEQAVADRLLGPELAAPTGLRTLAQGQGGFWPLSYHGGSIWSHDTAIAVMNLSRAGFTLHAAELATLLLSAAPAFDYRLPELFSGEGRPVPYPASCRPQAWAAAAGVVLATAPWGLAPDMPHGTIRMVGSHGGHGGAVASRVAGLRVGGRPLTLTAAGGDDRALRVECDPAVRVIATAPRPARPRSS